MISCFNVCQYVRSRTYKSPARHAMVSSSPHALTRVSTLLSWWQDVPIAATRRTHGRARAALTLPLREEGSPGTGPRFEPFPAGYVGPISPKTPSASRFASGYVSLLSTCPAHTHTLPHCTLPARHYITHTTYTPHWSWPVPPFAATWHLVLTSLCCLLCTHSTTFFHQDAPYLSLILHSVRLALQCTDRWTLYMCYLEGLRHS